MKIKVSEATNTQLDWLIAKCEGLEVESIQTLRSGGQYLNVWTVCCLTGEREHTTIWEPTTDWGQGGQIIEREFIAVFSIETCPFEGQWAADQNRHQQLSTDEMGDELYSFYPSGLQYGPTPLVAAMRCMVVSKLGSEVEVPEGLV